MQLLVAADDRTGAFEGAAVVADHGAGPVGVWPWTRIDAIASQDPEVAVVDLGTRHLGPAEAAIRASAIPGVRRPVHKIDSTLRGNWPDELAARSASAPVLLVPALPAAGRTCVGGEVHDHGRPVHEGGARTDVRRPVVTSRPADALRTAGVDVVVGLDDPQQVRAWLDAPDGVAIADAETDDDIERIVEMWATSELPLVLAGTSAAVGAAARVVSCGAEPSRLPAVDGPILIACGSVHPTVRRQLAFAEHRGMQITTLADDITAHMLEREGAVVLAAEIPVGDATAPIAVAAASALARGVHDLCDRVELGALVVIGGDTATAVLGAAPVVVHGSVAPGVAWVESDELAMPIVTRSGGLGADDALVDLLARLRRP